MAHRPHSMFDPASQTTLPGGGVACEVWSSRNHVIVSMIGEFDVVDVNALVDLFAGYILEGATTIQIDGSEIDFVDIRTLYAIDRTRRFLAASGGELSLTGLPRFFASVWSRICGGPTHVDNEGVSERHWARAS